MQTLIHRDSKPWQFQVWASFLIAVFLCAVGLSHLPGRDLDRAFMMAGLSFACRRHSCWPSRSVAKKMWTL